MIKKVLFFRPTLGEGGADRVQLAVLRGLDRARYRASLVLVKKSGPFVEDVPDDVEVIELGSPRLALSVPALVRVLASERPHVVFCTCSASNVIAATAHGFARSDARLVLSERNALYRGRSAFHPKQSLEVALKRLLYRRADLVTAVSQGVANELAERTGVPRAKISVVYNPMVDDDLITRAGDPIDHPWFAAGQPPIVLACARLVPQKDYRTLLHAFALVRRRIPCRLWVLGDGPLRAELEQHARDLGIADDVNFAGFDKNPFRFMARAKLLLHASRAEGLPGALIQSMACGTPVVSTDCDFGPREVVTHESNGYLAPVGDAAALASFCMRILTDPGHHHELASNARSSAQRFTSSSSLARYHAAIDGNS
ncbi:MAG: glycosyltransferase [Kofleriaceae bacterium]